MNAESNSVVALREKRREELAAVTFRPDGQMFQPKDGRELMDMANLMSTAGPLVKDMYRNNPGACMGLIAVCAPYGMNPLQVSWKTYQTKEDGPIAYESQVVVAMVNASGAVKGGLRYRYEGDGDRRRCIASGILKGDTEPVEVMSPPLGQITPKNSPLWKTDPDQQLAYYTGRAWARRYKPEMLLGIHDVDELSGPPIGPDAARDVTPAAPAPRRGGVVYADPDPVIDTILDAEAVEQTGTPPTDAEIEAQVLAELAARNAEAEGRA